VTRQPVGRSIAHVGLALTIAFGVLAGGAGYWQVIRSQELSTAPDNPAVVAAARQILRGRIVDRNGKVLASNERDENGEPYRVYSSKIVSPVVGYASRLYGSAGIERSSARS
jgi:peptidoglycan glycosyltransferase